jgi:hypothetical protein
MKDWHHERGKIEWTCYEAASRHLHSGARAEFDALSAYQHNGFLFAAG